jgi:hypothetical protein
MVVDDLSRRLLVSPRWIQRARERRKHLLDKKKVTLTSVTQFQNPCAIF